MSYPQTGKTEKVIHRFVFSAQIRVTDCNGFSVSTEIRDGRRHGQALIASVPSLHDHVVTTSEAFRHGITPDQLRTANLKAMRIARGVYLREGVRDDFRVKAEAALALCGEGAALCAQSALQHCGVELPWAAQDRKVHVLLSRGQRGTRMPWIQAHRPEILPQVDDYHGLPIVVPGQAWMQTVLYTSITDLVVMGDGLMRRKNPVMDKLHLGEIVLSWRGRRGFGRGQEAYSLIETGTDSPQETLVRLLLISAGLEKPQVNYRVKSPWGYFLLDLAYGRWKVAIEYDGAVHVGDTNQMEQDRTRRRWLEDHGWRIITVTKADMTQDPQGIVSSVVLALAAAKRG